MSDEKHLDTSKPFVLYIEYKNYMGRRTLGYHFDSAKEAQDFLYEDFKFNRKGRLEYATIKQKVESKGFWGKNIEEKTVAEFVYDESLPQKWHYEEKKYE